MKWLTQIALPIAIVIALIAGVTFVSHYLGRPPNATVPTAAHLPGQGFALRPVPGTTWLPADDAGPADYELHQDGYRDFWFQQPHPEPVQMGLVAKGCGCSEVSVAVMGPMSATSRPDQEKSDRLPRWQTLAVADDAAVTIPAGSAEQPVVGVLRLSWRGRKPGEEGMTFRLWSQIGKAPRASEKFRHPLNFVPALLAFPTQATLPDSDGGQPVKAEFWSWSRTRKAIPLQLQLEGGERGFTCSARSATAEDLAGLPKEIEPSTVRVAQRVTVSLTNAAELDLGPFERRLVLTTEPAAEPALALLQGVVRGPIKVGTPRDRDQIDLGSFAARKGTQRRIALEAEEPGLQLEMLAKTPDFLDARLEALPAVDGRGRWQLAVTIPADAALGRLSPDSGVVLQVRGAAVRKLRVPVVGQATQ